MRVGVGVGRKKVGDGAVCYSIKESGGFLIICDRAEVAKSERQVASVKSLH